ncbi:unnamed protein product [Leptosia nina]|uniref:N-terminal methionine N(alpha)-acetyltransferase NatC n=1 Tax=Leptosia nina TaxID=320188 RepID=A0AAV1J547_9NEOP
MSHLAEDNVQNLRGNSNCANVKNKTIISKDSLEAVEKGLREEEEKLTELLTHSLHINHHNISNGIILKMVHLTKPIGNTDKDTIHIEDVEDDGEIAIISYESELQMPEIMRLIQKDLSEPYSIYTYRYFIHNWPKLCFLAIHEGKCIGAIVCKLDMHRNVVKRGYIAMLAVDKKYRKKGIGSKLVQKAIQVMINDNADEVVLETEITNKPALKLYENLGFVRDKRLFRYYLNGVDALRLKLWLR